MTKILQEFNKDIRYNSLTFYASLDPKSHFDILYTSHPHSTLLGAGPEATILSTFLINELKMQE